MIVNNTTVINQTINITKVQVVNKTVINDGPQPEVIERKSGRKIEAVPVHELRRHEETLVAGRQRNIPTPTGRKDRRPVVAESAPPGTIPPRVTPQVEPPATVPARSQPTAKRNEIRGIGPPESPLKSEPPRGDIPARNEGRQEIKHAPEARPPAHAQDKPQTGNPPDADRRAQPPVRNEVRGVGETNSRSALPGSERQTGHERQRELERQKDRPETRQTAAPGKSPQLPTNRPAAKPKPTEKPAANERGGRNAKKKDDKKKPVDQESPPQQPAAPPRSPP
ncbi:MAG: hypothetical protein DME19_18290 [Verrucomicrobia bacterium]|nr:MAG: hypothetical protein DME19_18290 [Verrucomicrobiota bacterium]